MPIGATMIGAALAAAATGGTGPCPPPPPPGMIARSTTFGGVMASRAEDADEAVRAGEVARVAAARYLGLDVPRFLIADPVADANATTIAETTAAGAADRIAKADPGSGTGRSAAHPPRGGCAFVFVWPLSTLHDGARHPPTHVLPHEIGHALFIRFLVPGSGADQYGGDAPDWLDEMAALACEDAAGVRMRRADARRHAERGALLPLARLLVMPHPEWKPGAAGAAVALGAARSQPGSADTPAFYATVRALFDFLIHRTGDERVVRRLAEQVRAGARVDRWLLTRAARRGDARGLAGLDAQIAAFVLGGPVEDAARPTVVAEGPG